MERVRVPVSPQLLRTAKSAYITSGNKAAIFKASPICSGFTAGSALLSRHS